MLTGWHRVRDVFCINCHQKLGWSYEYAMDESQQYKEGKVILENALVEKYLGFDDEDDDVDGGYEVGGAAHEAEEAGDAGFYDVLEITNRDNDNDTDTSGTAGEPTANAHERLSLV